MVDLDKGTPAQEPFKRLDEITAQTGVFAVEGITRNVLQGNASLLDPLDKSP